MLGTWWCWNELGANEAHEALKDYVFEFNTQMNGATKVDELAKKLIVLDGVAKLGGECLVQVLKASWRRGKDHQDCESIEADGP